MFEFSGAANGFAPIPGAAKISLMSLVDRINVRYCNQKGTLKHLQKPDQKGFTLIEIMSLMVIMGVLV